MFGLKLAGLIVDRLIIQSS